MFTEAFTGGSRRVYNHGLHLWLSDNGTKVTGGGEMIDWANALWAGLAGGIAMGVWAMLMHMAGYSRMSMTSYEGCMITGEDSGSSIFMAGMAMHLMLSVLIAFVYAWAFETIWNEASWFYGLLLGIAHWIVGSLALPMMDGMNGCVKRNAMNPMRLFANGYGSGAVVTFLIGHLIYGAVVGWLYSVRGT